VGVRIVPAVCYNQGREQLNKNNCAVAYSYLKPAYRLNPGNADYRYYYAKSMVCVPVTLSVQKDMFRIATGKDHDSSSVLADNKITDWRYNFGENYIEQAPSSDGIVRWDEKSFPLKVYFETRTQAPPYYEAETFRAFSQWEKSSGFLKFVRTKNKSEANIIVEVVPSQHHCEDIRCLYVVGVTVPEIKSGRIKLMTITMYATDPAGNYFSEKDFYNTVVHEAGHALGIMGHSYGKDDIMYMSSDGRSLYSKHRSDFQSLSERDVNTIRLLYKLDTPAASGSIYPPVVLGTGEQINERKIEEALHYIEQAPNMASGYVDLGSAYAQNRKYDDALKAFNKAYALSTNDDEKYITLYNISVTYLNKKDFGHALEYAEKARALNDSNEIRELIKIIKK
jgi:predicted Zn-dependent protease